MPDPKMTLLNGFGITESSSDSDSSSDDSDSSNSSSDSSSTSDISVSTSSFNKDIISSSSNNNRNSSSNSNINGSSIDINGSSNTKGSNSNSNINNSSDNCSGIVNSGGSINSYSISDNRGHNNDSSCSIISSSSSDTTSISDKNESKSTTGNRSDAGEVYIVDKIVDFRLVKDESTGVELTEYRVRWSGYEPCDDTWEPAKSFATCQPVLQEFLEFLKAKEAEKAAVFNAVGEPHNLDPTCYKNILSEHIDHIALRRQFRKTGKDGKSMYLYKVFWKGPMKGFTWETRGHLVHASDKIQEFDTQKNRRQSKMQAYKKQKREQEEGEAAATVAGGEDPDHVRRSEERKFYENLPKVTVTMEGDLYSRLKARRSRTQIYQGEGVEPSSLEGSYVEHPRSKYMRKELGGASSSTTTELKEQTIKRDSADSLERRVGNCRDGLEATGTPEEQCQLVMKITAGLPQYNVDEVEEEFRRRAEQNVVLSKEEFLEAVHCDDYEMILDSLRSDSVPDVDWSELFLEVARCSKRDMALLLATRVPDLTMSDLWGENALTIAAKQGDVIFAYGLLQLGVPLNLRNCENQTAYEVAALNGNLFFKNFCKNFSLELDISLE